MALSSEMDIILFVESPSFMLECPMKSRITRIGRYNVSTFIIARSFC